MDLFVDFDMLSFWLLFALLAIFFSLELVLIPPITIRY